MRVALPGLSWKAWSNPHWAGPFLHQAPLMLRSEKVSEFGKLRVNREGRGVRAEGAA